MIDPDDLSVYRKTLHPESPESEGNTCKIPNGPVTVTRHVFLSKETARSLFHEEGPLMELLRETKMIQDEEDDHEQA